MANAIEIKNLTKFYGKNRGIKDVSFEVNEGEIYGFIGPNGAGKSTTLRILIGLIFPTSGEASMLGEDVVANGHRLREKVGYLPSEVFYYDGMKVMDLLKYSASFYKKDCTKKIADLCEKMELDTSRKIDDLSYGNKKKVGIVQGLLHSPELIILDEPTSGLDPLMQQKFFDIIKEENNKGATVLFSSHILGEVQKLCDRVSIIKEGSIIRTDEVKTLKKESYKKFKIECRDLDMESFKKGELNDFKKTDSYVSFLYKGDINYIIDVVAKHTITDMRIEEPTLEEIFMHYYR